MTQEPLEGVLSETLLDEIASDLGIDPKVLRAHPIFRVLGGMVMLTYPLKTAGTPEFQPVESKSQTDPVGHTYYEVMNHVGTGILYSAWVKVDDAIADVFKYLKYTIDGVACEAMTPASDTSQDYWHAAGHVHLTKNPSSINVSFNESLKVEAKVSGALAGGKKVEAKAYWGKLE